MATPDAPGRFGLYIGTVAEVNDPEQRGRIRVRVPELFGDTVLAGWALPIGQHLGDGSGSMIIPTPGAVVFVQFLSGSTDLPVYQPGAWAQSPAETSSDPQYPPLQNGYPEKRMLLRSHRGHTLSITEEENGDATLMTEKTLLRMVNEDGRIELDVRGGPDGKVVVNEPSENQLAARKGDPVEIGSLSFTFVPNSSGTPASLSITYVPPGEGAPVTLATGSGTITLQGLINGGSPSVLIGD